MRFPSFAIIILTALGILSSPISTSQQPTSSPPAGQIATKEAAITPPKRRPITSANAAQVVEQTRLGQGTLGSFAWSPNGKMLVVSSSLGLWLYQTDHLDATPQLLGNGIGCDLVAFSADGATLASCGNNAAIGLWNVNTTTEEAELKLDNDTICNLAFSADGSLIAAGSVQGSIALWDVKTGTQLGLSDRKRGSVCSLAFSPDGATIAFGGWQGDVNLWDVKTSTSHLLSRQFGTILSLAYSHNGDKLAVANEDSTQVLDVKTGVAAAHLVKTYGLGRSVAFSPDGTLLATGSFDGIIRFFDAETGLRRGIWQGHDGPILNLGFSPDGKLLTSSGADNTVRLWDVQTGKQQAVLQGFGSIVTNVAFSPDGITFAASAAGNVSGVKISQWQLASGSQEPVAGNTFHVLPSQQIFPNEVNSLAFSTDGSELASGDADGTVRLWDVKTTKQVDRLNIGGVFSLSFNPDGKLLTAAGGGYGWVSLWQVQTATHVSTRQDYKAESATIDTALSPDGMLVASIETLGTVSVWNVKTGARQILADQYGFGSHVAFSPDGQTLASSSWNNEVQGIYSEAQVHLWNVKTGAERMTLKAQGEQHVSLAFSPDGSLLATGDHDGNLTLWDIKTGVARAVLKGHRSAISCMTFSTDGGLLLSGSRDGTVRLWAVSTSNEF